MSAPRPDFDPRTIDIDALERDLNALRDELRVDVQQDPGAHASHLRRMVLWGRGLMAAGFATAWIAPNPLSILCISLAIFSRWAMVAHHVIHRGYDRVPGVPARYTSKVFAKGWRRPLDWSDWMDPEGWRIEHNTLHHYHLGEVDDPDQPEHNLGWLRDARLPMWLKRVVVAVGATTWKPLYYAPNVIRTLYAAQLRRKKEDPGAPVDFFEGRLWSPFHQPGRQVWWRCWLPYVVLHFVLVPLPFLALGTWAWFSVLANRLLAEVLTNLHAFLVIVPNHAGDDLYRFDTPIEGRGDFYLRQIVGSTNYRTGTDRIDFLHGWLNYQIEHHLFPDMTMLQYRAAQPRVEAICAAHGVPYVQESVWRRLGKLVDVMVGEATMPSWPRQGLEEPGQEADQESIGDGEGADEPVRSSSDAQAVVA